MVGKKKWTIFELCAVRAMLKMGFADEDIIENFPRWFPDAKHSVEKSSLKHVQLEYLSADEYESLEAQWEDIPGKKGYLLGLFALRQDRDVIADNITSKFASHQWPEHTSKADAVDIATSTFHSCGAITDQQSPIALYSEDNPEAYGLVTMVVNDFNDGRTIEMINEATAEFVPVDHIIFILTRFRANFCDEWQPEAPHINLVNQPVMGYGSAHSVLGQNEAGPSGGQNFLVGSTPYQPMDQELLDPALRDDAAAANYPTPDAQVNEPKLEKARLLPDYGGSGAVNYSEDWPGAGADDMFGFGGYSMH